MIKRYLKDESALDAEISKVIMIVIVIAAVIAIGWWVWNMISGQVSSANNMLGGASNNPNTSNPFGAGTSPFG